MPLTRVFKSGNSQAVRIPPEIAYEDVTQELEIRRHGDVIMLMPARRSLGGLAEALRALPMPRDVETREVIELPEREAT